jgi:glycosyltransferase involved in cell wall biosynthesis
MFHLGINARALINPQTRGLSRHTFNLVKYLKIIAPQIKVSLFSNMPIAARFRQELETYPNIHFIDSGIPSKNRWEFLVLPKLLSQSNIDIFHSPINQGIPPLPSRIKSVLTLHDLFTHEDMWLNLKQGHLWTYLSYRYSLHHSLKANRIIAVSHYTKNAIDESFPRLGRNVDVVYNGADESTTQQRLANLPSGRYIAYVGGLESRKNTDFLVKHFSQFYFQNTSKTIPYLLIAGPPHSANPSLLKQLNQTKGIIFYPNPTDQEVESIFQHAYCTIHPSLREGFGLQLIESIKAQTPMLASNIPPFKEIAEGCCEYFDPADGESLINSLIKITEDSNYREHLKNNCVAKMEHFSWKKMATETLDIYTKLLEHKFPKYEGKTTS